LFFFQAEDGIRDFHVTGVQTCALPISIPELTGNATLRYGNRDKSTEVNATSADFPLARQWAVAEGSFFSPEDENLYATVAVIGQIGRASCRESVKKWGVGICLKKEKRE